MVQQQRSGSSSGLKVLSSVKIAYSPETYDEYVMHIKNHAQIMGYNMYQLLSKSGVLTTPEKRC